MVGLKASAKGKRVGSLSGMWKDENAFLQAKWPKFFKPRFQANVHTVILNMFHQTLFVPFLVSHVSVPPTTFLLLK